VVPITKLPRAFSVERGFSTLESSRYYYDSGREEAVEEGSGDKNGTALDLETNLDRAPFELSDSAGAPRVASPMV
jgi:hypothetical protein